MGNKPTLKVKTFAELSELSTVVAEVAPPASATGKISADQVSTMKNQDLFQRKTRPGVPADWLGEFRWIGDTSQFGESLKVVDYLGPCPVYA